MDVRRHHVLSKDLLPLRAQNQVFKIDHLNSQIGPITVTDDNQFLMFSSECRTVLKD